MPTEINARVTGQANSSWTDPHNAGTYTILSSGSGTMQLTRKTGDGKYTDKQTFTFTANGAGCAVTACSESQVTSVIDYSTNFCDLHDLYCADKGCHVQVKALTYSEDLTDCNQHDKDNCLKV